MRYGQVLTVSSVALLCVGVVLFVASRFLGLPDPVPSVFMDMAIVSVVYAVFVLCLLAVFPKRVEPEAVFTGGAAKPPYISAEELYRPRLRRGEK